MKKKNPLYYRKFGFELEFSSKFEIVLKYVKTIIPQVYGKDKLHIENQGTHVVDDKFKKWEFKYDGSTECELTTLISTLNDFTKLEHVLEKLNQKSIDITKHDSVHVHMQANDVPKHNIIAAWIQIEKGIMKCFPKHRRHNSYCQKLIHGKKYKKISDFFIKAEDESKEHHAILSLNYYQERKTVEFRIMEGNININLIRPWVKFCMLFLNYAKHVDPIKIICGRRRLRTNVKEIIELMRIKDKDVIEFLELRQKMME